MANVYWIKGRSENIQKNVISKIDALLSLEEMARLVSPDESLAIKTNLSEMGYSHYLPGAATRRFWKSHFFGYYRNGL